MTSKYSIIEEDTRDPLYTHCNHLIANAQSFTSCGSYGTKIALSNDKGLSKNRQSKLPTLPNKISQFLETYTQVLESDYDKIKSSSFGS